MSAGADPGPGGGRDLRPGPWFFAALAVRVAAVFALDTPGAAEGATAWEWGAETACLAESIADGRGYGDPWAHGTGPSSWLTPPFPALVALLLELFGGVGRGSATALFLVQSLLSAATAELVARIGARLGDERVGRVAGWAFALYPLAIWNAAQTVWDTTAVAFAVALFFLVLLAVRPGAAGAALVGLVYGALLFLNPAPLAMLPAVVVWLVWTRGLRRGAVDAAVLCGVAALVLLPWSARNRRVLGTWQPRPNFGVELRIGNHDQAHGRPVPWLYHPSHVEAERALYLELGEVGYAAENADRALAWIRANPGAFARLSVHRARLFWFGEPPTADPRRSQGYGAANDAKSWIKFLVFALTGAAALAGWVVGALGRPERWLLGGSLVLFGAPYYLTHVSERYRFPVDPLVVLLDAWLLVWILDRMRRPRSG